MNIETIKMDPRIGLPHDPRVPSDLSASLPAPRFFITGQYNAGNSDGWVTTFDFQSTELDDIEHAHESWSEHPAHAASELPSGWRATLETGGRVETDGGIELGACK